MIIDDLLNMIRMNALCHYQTWESHRQTVVVDVNREETQKKTNDEGQTIANKTL